MNTMDLDGCKATISYDTGKDRFRGEILGLNGGADFHGRTPAELHAEVVAAADASGVSLNKFVERSLHEAAEHR